MANETKQKNAETMEEILYGCTLARQLESNLFNLANQPDMLSRSIDEIVRTFTAAKERVSISHQDLAASFSPMLPHEAFKEEPQQPQMGATFVMQEWVRSSFSQPMDPLIQMGQVQAPIRSTTPFDMRSFLESKMGMEIHKLRPRGTSLQISEMGGRDVEGSERSKGSEGEVQPVEASSLRQRRRKDDAEKNTVTLPGNQFGNTEMPPEDGFTWRKYGQKEILGSKYPRSYYRCTHQKLYECPAKKQVQRVDDNPNFFAVTYRGNHTCHMSSTAPSSVPPQLLLDISQDMTQTISPQLSPSSTSASRWLQSSMHLSLHGGCGGSIAPAGGDARAGPSTSRYGRDREIDYGVAELADAMFNSGSSSGNSMESLFPLAEEREPGEKKSS